MLDIPKIRAVLFNPVLPLEELAAWEELAKAALPEDYRTYLTQLGNGGAGPAYGLYPLSLPKDEIARFLRRPCIYSDGQEEKFQDVVQRFVHWEDFDDDWSCIWTTFPTPPPGRTNGGRTSTGRSGETSWTG